MEKGASNTQFFFKWVNNIRKILYVLNKLNKVTCMFLILTRLEILEGESSAWHFNFKIGTEDIKSMTGQKVQSGG